MHETKNECFIKATGIQKSFPGVLALQGVDFTLHSGEIHALLGENGAGKSTLIKILAGLYQSDGGEIEVCGKKVAFATPSDSIASGISVIHQELNLVGHLSIAENIYCGRLPHKALGIVDQKKLQRDAATVLKKVGLHLSPSTQVRFLSIAQQQLVEIAKAISFDCKVLIMDEPTSSLSPKEIELLFVLMRELKAQGIGIVYVSHKLNELYAVCDKVSVLRDGTYIGTQNMDQINQPDLIKMMVGRDVVNNDMRVEKTAGEVILRVQGFFNYKLRNVSFDVKKGEILGFSGLMGAGKTEIARALFGVDAIDSGTLEINGKMIQTGSSQICKKHGIGYVPEDRKLEGLFLSHSVLQNMTIASLGQVSNGNVIQTQCETMQAKEMVKKLRVKTPSLRQTIGNLSGGNQQKVILARWLMSNQLKVLIIDEPTRGIDVGAKFEIYQILNELAQSGISIVLMSSEMQELLNLCDRIIVLKEGQLSAELENTDIDQEIIMQYAVS